MIAPPTNESGKEALAQLLREFPTWGHAALHYKAENERLREAPGKLSIIGYDVQLIDELAKRLHAAVRQEHEHTDPRETRRGCYFEVKLADSRIARVTVELDRVDPDA
jgi:hypothetical protein